MNASRVGFLSGILVLTASFSTIAFAVDGVILIDQNRAFAGNVTPGDTPGFPVTLSRSGSYRLSGNLTVPDAVTTAIEIAADHVTLDLNGFAILGPVDCSGGFPCAGVPPGIGGDGVRNSMAPLAFRFNITVRNGTIQGMGGLGVLLLGESILVEHVNVRSNGGGGIRLIAFSEGGSTVRDTMAESNGQGGIRVDAGLVSHSNACLNEVEGISLLAGTVSYSFASLNGQDGLGLGNRVSYFGNNLDGNGRFPVSGGHNHGQNLCNGVTCPGAQF